MDRGISLRQPALRQLLTLGAGQHLREAQSQQEGAQEPSDQEGRNDSWLPHGKLSRRMAVITGDAVLLPSSSARRMIASRANLFLAKRPFNLLPYHEAAELGKDGRERESAKGRKREIRTSLWGSQEFLLPGFLASLSSVRCA